MDINVPSYFIDMYGTRKHCYQTYLEDVMKLVVTKSEGFVMWKDCPILSNCLKDLIQLLLVYIRK